MIYLLLSILASTIIFIIFKLFEKFHINIFQAIVVNYCIAFTTGILSYNGTITISQLPNLDWFYYTLILGALFIIVFNLMGITTQKNGLSVVSVATKMSVVVPVLFGLLYYNENLGAIKLFGIGIALIAVYLTSNKSDQRTVINRKLIVLPILVFVGSGIIDTSIKFLEDAYVADNDVPLFSAIIFLAAAIIGFIIIIIQVMSGSFKFEFKNVIAGICLGVPNYFSIYFLVKTLRSDILESSGIFAINNVSIVTLSTFAGIFIFKEKLIKKNWIGIGLAILSIILISI
ncbi:MAG: EamA/RhaT family transporter [Flavobacteriaceae bacterium]|nr:EamA/RhaT family transporter [Flavobacteriaceae bacterium]